MTVVGGDCRGNLDFAVGPISASLFLQQRVVVHVTCTVALHTTSVSHVNIILYPIVYYPYIIKKIVCFLYVIKNESETM